jgi:acid phosphatase
VGLSLLSLSCGFATNGKWFDRIVIIQFENHSELEVLADPNFHHWASVGRAMMEYYAVAHPSQPNYWAQVAGSFFDWYADLPLNLPWKSVFELFDEHGVTYKGYMEDYPGQCFLGETNGKYYRKHNPVITFDYVSKNPTRCARVVNATQFDADLNAGTLPNWSYFTPNINNDGHNTNVTFAGTWLNSFLTPRVNKFKARTLVVISWDEDDYTERNHILVSLLDPNGDIFAAGSKDPTRYDHYSLLATIEQNWGLGNLGRNDVGATIFNFSASA